MSTYAGASGVSHRDVSDWLLRVDEVTTAIKDFINEDPVEAEIQRKLRERKRVESQAAEASEKIKNRYDVKRSIRFESDAVIEKLLADVDKPEGQGKAMQLRDEGNISTFEKVALVEARRLKEEAAVAVRAGKWESACELYSQAIALDPVDRELYSTLRNNRALVHNKLGKYVEAVDDATVVLRGRGGEDCGRPNDVKALLRRAVALGRLHRADDAAHDVARVLTLQPENQEAADISKSIEKEKEEMNVYRELLIRAPDVVRELQSEALRLAKCVDRLADFAKSTEAAKSGETGAVAECTSLLCRLAQLLGNERGGGILMHAHGGTAAVVELWRVVLRDAPLLTARAGSMLDTLLAAGFRVTALIFRSSSIALHTLSAESVDMLISAARRWCGVPVENISQNTRVVAAALDTLDAMSEAYPTQVVRNLSGDQFITAFALHQKVRGSTALYYLLKWMATLLNDPHGRDLLLATTKSNGASPDSGHLSGVTAVLADCTYGVPLQEAAVEFAVLLVAAERNSEGSKGSVGYTSRMLDESFLVTIRQLLPPSASDLHSWRGSAALLEAIYALLYNLTIQAPSRAELASTLDAQGMLKICADHVFLCNGEFSHAHGSDGKEKNVPQEKSLLTKEVVCKAIGVLARLAPVNPHLRSVMAAHTPVFWGFLDSLRQDSSARTDSAHNPAVDNVVLCLAALYIGSNPASHIVAVNQNDGDTGGRRSWQGTSSTTPNSVLWFLNEASTTPVTVGNLALLLSVVPESAHAPLVENDAMRVLLQRLRATRSQIHEMERHSAAQRNQQLLATMNAAQSNLAIAISKLAVTPVMRDQLRDMQGFETLMAVRGNK